MVRTGHARPCADSRTSGHVPTPVGSLASGSIDRVRHRGGAMTTQLPGTLADRVRGQVIRPGDADYEEARRGYNARCAPGPERVVRCTGTDDVAATVRYAAESGRPLAVRGGGHSVPGF